jgi:hypothetical protein
VSLTPNGITFLITVIAIAYAYSSRLRQVLLAGTGPTGALTHKIEKGSFHEQAKFQLRLA